MRLRFTVRDLFGLTLVVALCAAWCLVAIAQEPATEVDAAIPAGQFMVRLPVRVVDADGKPVADAKIFPWALRSSQGHGLWRADDKRAELGPKEVVTDESGAAEVAYPYYRDYQEQIRTTSVSLYVDHPEYAYIDHLHIDVPLQADGSYKVVLTRGVSLEIRPLIEAKPADVANLYAMWSDGRSWRHGSGPVQTKDGTLLMPAMAPGKNSVLLVKLDGEHATHFSRITDVELKPGEAKKVDVELRPSMRIEGALSFNVPRPVRNGRIKTETLPPAGAGSDRVSWCTWAPIRPDGTFVIDGWPAGEAMQLIALCDGYVATSGKAPDVVANRPDPNERDPFNRPQVFQPQESARIVVAMMPMVRCEVTALDAHAAPVAGVKVVSWPNVGWWNVGSQIYGEPLVRWERLLRVRDYMTAREDVYPPAFEAMTNEKGKAILELPPGKEWLAVQSEAYDLPILQGQREIPIELTAGKTTQAALQLEPRGTEKIGEWEWRQKAAEQAAKAAGAGNQGAPGPAQK